MCGIEAIDSVSTIANVIVSAAEVANVVSSKVQGDYQTEMLVQQAKTSEKNAAYERQEGIEEARSKRLKAILNMSEQKTTLAAGNISLSSATAINIVDDEKLNGEIDALNTLKSSERKAQSYLDTAQNYYSQAALTSYKTNTGFASGLLKIGGSINNTIKMYN